MSAAAGAIRLIEACRRAGLRDAADIVELELARAELSRTQRALVRLAAQMADAQAAVELLEAMLIPVLRGWSSGDAELAMQALDEFFGGAQPPPPRGAH